MKRVNYNTLPKDLPIPKDDGLCNHLSGLEIPNISLLTVNGDYLKLRRKEFLCTHLKMSLKTTAKKKIKATEKFQKLNDSFSLLEKADSIWKKLTCHYKIFKIIQINVVLYGLHSINSVQINLLDNLKNETQKNKRKKKLISQTIDSINSRFGRDSVTIGALPSDMIQFSGTKVAFTRIPEIKEFYE